jgi:hypothetical protein
MPSQHRVWGSVLLRDIRNATGSRLRIFRGFTQADMLYINPKERNFTLCFRRSHLHAIKSGSRLLFKGLVYI